jgi:hypothetical protein
MVLPDEIGDRCATYEVESRSAAFEIVNAIGAQLATLLLDCELPGVEALCQRMRLTAPQTTVVVLHPRGHLLDAVSPLAMAVHAGVDHLPAFFATA